MNALRELFVYNAWAMRITLDAVARLPSDQYLRDMQGSHGGIHGTLQHIVWAEHLWLNRWLIRPNPAVPQGKDLETLAAVRARFEETEAERNRFLETFSDHQLADTRRIKPTSGGAYQHTFAQMFHHLVNHSSYHRGQVVTFLRQLGVTPPNTDLIVFYRVNPDRPPAP